MKKRIILASDEPGVRRLLTGLLEDEGLAVTATLDGRQTLESVERKPPDLLILDLNMPVVDGREIVRVLHERKLMLFPILVFTGIAEYDGLHPQRHAPARHASDLDRVVALAKRLAGDVLLGEPEAAALG